MLPLPSTVYQQRIADGELMEDSAQSRALSSLDRLHSGLVSANQKHTDQGFLARWFRRPQETEQGCYLWGGVGTGKSMLMDLFHQSLGDVASRRIHFHRFMGEIHDRKTALGHIQDPLKVIAGEISDSCRVLCLDEFLVTDITDAMILAGLLTNLFANNCVLVTTSNTAIAELYRDGLQRQRFLPAIELLEANMVQINVDQGQDYRMNCLRDDGIYHIPADHTAIERMELTFTQLGQGPFQEGGAVSINDRDIPVTRVRPGVIWFGFDQICKTRRAARDYIEISRQYHTVLVTDIPQLSESDNDAARRFIELVDELYDRNVNLIVSSDYSPENLYIGKRLEAPFQRTASRLVEMSSEAYLSQPHLG